jgi:hypothetical protein
MFLDNREDNYRAGGLQEVPMAVRLMIHYDNLAGLARPHLRLWHSGASPVDQQNAQDVRDQATQTTTRS